MEGLVAIAALITGAAVAAAQPEASRMQPPPPPPPPPDGGMPASMPAPMPLPVAPPPPPQRGGLFAGGGLWGGNISCDGTDCGALRAAGGASGHIGYLFTPRLGLLLDLWAMTSSQNDIAISYITATINVRYWVAPVVWIEAGAGNGHALIHAGIFAARGDDVPVGQLAAGVEVVRGRTWALDVQAKVAQGTATDVNGDDIRTGRSVGVGAAITWYGQQ